MDSSSRATNSASTPAFGGHVAPSIRAVPEIVDDGQTGILTASAANLAPAIERARMLDRRNIVHRARERFSIQQIALRYEAHYQQECSQHGNVKSPAAPPISPSPG